MKKGRRSNKKAVDCKKYEKVIKQDIYTYIAKQWKFTRIYYVCMDEQNETKKQASNCKRTNERTNI